ncbi:MAG TPA: UbiD family decarboxylase [Dehalococcoidales bacterium]|nr:UbiD family decarboxylase [Dehalococcoidales bacterium]
MPDRDLRAWMAQLEAEGDLKRIKAKVDWDDEISQIIRKVYVQEGPALLFENIKGHEATWSKKLFTNGLGTRSRVNVMLGLPRDTSPQETVKTIRKRMKNPLEPVRVKTGPVKENIIKGEDVDLFQIPVPKWHPLDNGRYINTFNATVTKDPDTGQNNAGVYRGTILSKNKIGVLLMPMKDWGITYRKYQEMGKPMPVAFVYGWDPTLIVVAGSPVVGPEYDLAGALRQQPVELVRCETSDIEVPASAEIVVEGFMSPDPSTYEIEGPFGEGSGFYGEARNRPVVEVSCITHRNDAIFRGSLVGTKEGITEIRASVSTMMSVVLWNTLEATEIPGVLDVVSGPITAVKIHKTYQGQPRQIAAAIWGSKFAGHPFNILMVVEEDVDIRNPAALMGAMHSKVDFNRDLVVYPLYMGSPIDVSLPYDFRAELDYGAAIANKLLIDATTDWQIHPPRAEWGNQRFPPNCHYSRKETEELVEKRWKEYGL